MEQQPHRENGPQPTLSGSDIHETGEGVAEPTIDMEFGYLSLVAPDGGSWSEWVITHGVEQAMREGRPIDDRTASYIADWLTGDLTPALHGFVVTGAVDGPGVQEELVHSFFAQTQQVQGWIDWFGHYCMHRADRGPVRNWREDIEYEDRTDAEQVRRERVSAQADALFDRVPVIQRVGNAGKPGWHGLVRHEGCAGGWIVSEGEAGTRRVWESDSDAELEAAYVVIVEAQRQWILDTFGGRTEPGV